MSTSSARPTLRHRRAVSVMVGVVVAACTLFAAAVGTTTTTTTTTATGVTSSATRAAAAATSAARLADFVTPVVVDGRAPSDQELGGFLAVVHGDLTATWTRLLDSSGVAPSTRLALFRTARTPVLDTGCGPVRSDVGPFFCGADGTIYLGLEFARAVWGYVGDMALVQVVGHEFGHSLQLLLGLVPVAGSPAFELQADCLGGAYAEDAAARGLLEDGDAEEAREVSRLVGDDGSSENPHGSPDEREQAWMAGFEGGLASCLAL